MQKQECGGRVREKRESECGGMCSVLGIPLRAAVTEAEKLWQVQMAQQTRSEARSIICNGGDEMDRGDCVGAEES